MLLDRNTVVTWNTLHAFGIACIWFASLSMAANPAMELEQHLELPDGRKPSETFGWSLAVDAGTLIAGAPGTGTAGNWNRGRAEIYERTEDGWVFKAKLTPLPSTHGSTIQSFGEGVAISGSVAAVTCSEGITGQVYFFSKQEGEWRYLSHVSMRLWLRGSSGIDGPSLTLGEGGNIMAVGSPFDSEVRIFERSGDVWTLQATLTGGSKFGASLSLSGSTLVVGATERGTSASGKVYVFDRVNGSWSETAVLQPGNSSNTQLFGTSLALDGPDRLLIGGRSKTAPYATGWLFARSGGTWVEQAKLQPQSSTFLSTIAASVTLSGDTAFLGDSLSDTQSSVANKPGRLVVFRRSPSDGTWKQVQTIQGERDDELGAATVFDSTTLISGAPGREGGRGKLVLFELAGQSWSKVSELGVVASDDTYIGSGFGSSIHVDGDIAVVGAPIARTYLPAVPDRGAAYVFKRGSSGVWTAIARLTDHAQAVNPAVYASFGSSVAISGNYILVGAPDAFNGNSYGRAYLYQVVGDQVRWIKTINPPGGYKTTNFGASLDMEGVAAVISATGESRAWVYENLPSTDEASVLLPDGLDLNSSGSGVFGNQIKLDGNTIAAASAGPNSSVFLYQRTSLGWKQQGSLRPLKGIFNALQTSISLSGDSLAVALSGRTAADVLISETQVYARRSGKWALQSKIQDAKTTLTGRAVAMKNGLLFTTSGILGSNTPNSIAAATQDKTSWTVADHLEDELSLDYTYFAKNLATDGDVLLSSRGSIVGPFLTKLPVSVYRLHPLLQLTLGGVNESVEIGPDGIDLGQHIIGRRVKFTLNLINQGLATLRGTQHGEALSCQIDGLDQSEFAIATTIPGAIIRQGSNSVILEINPRSLGAKTASLTIASNDPEHPLLQIPIQALVTANAEAPSFTHSPLSWVATPGESKVLEGIAAGTAPLSYQWLKNGKPIPGQTRRQLQLEKVAASQAGSYALRVRNEFGESVSVAANVVVVTDTGPVLKDVLEGRTVVLQAKIAGSGYDCLWLPGASADPSTVMRFAGRNTPQLTIINADEYAYGDYSLRVTAGSMVREFHLFTIHVYLKPRVTPFAAGPWQVGKLVDQFVRAENLLSDPSERIVADQLPPGLSIESRFMITGYPTKPGNYRMKLTAINLAGKSAPIEIPVVVLPFPSELVGSWTGLVKRDTGFNASRGGLVKLNVTAAGTFSAKLQLGASTWSSSGWVGNNSSSPVWGLQGPWQGSQGLSWWLDFPSESAGQGAGILFKGQNPPFFALEVWKNVPQPAAAWSGRYTVSISPSGPADSNPTVPQGIGYGVLDIASNGTATWSGRLAEGSVVTSSTAAVRTSAAGMAQVPLYLPDASGAGSVQGRLDIVQTDIVFPEYNQIAGILTHFRAPAPQTKAVDYSAGFAEYDLQAFGRRYFAPRIGDILLGLAPTTRNAQLTFSEAGIEMATLFPNLDDPFQITDLHQAVFRLPDATNTTLNLDPATGVFTGTFDLLDNLPPKISRKGTFFGVLFPLRSEGLGTFLIPKKGGSASDRLSGNVRLGPYR